MAKFKARNLLIGSAALGIVAAGLLNAPSVIAQMGLFFGYPIVGQGSYCITSLNPAPPNANGNGAGQATQCVATAPAGPAGLTGNELVIANTELPGGQTPQTVFLPSGVLIQHGFGGERNVLVGADFATNLWQRGTTPLSAATVSTPLMSADRWAVYSPASQVVTVTKDVTAADVAPALGVNGIAKVTRPSGTDTHSICIGQVMPVTESARFVSNEAVFSFYAEALAGYLQTNSTIIATIGVYTGTDSATPFTNTSSFMQGTTTGYTVLNPVAGSSTILNPVLTGTASTATIPLTTSLARYSVAAYVPPQVSVSGTLTNVTGIGVTLCTGTYPASTGVATDGFAFGNAQLEVTSPGALGIQNGATVLVSQPITTPGGFARRAIGEEEVAMLAYTSPGGLGQEVATTFYMAGGCQASGNANFGVVFNPPLRITPTGATSTLTAGGYSIKTAAAVTAIGTITVVGASRYEATVNSNAACTATLPYQIVGSAATGLILFSAEP
jgi:hypothetical protein